MNDFAGGETYDEIFTAGLGPCLGIAFAYISAGYVFHGHGVRQGTAVFDQFLTVAKKISPLQIEAPFGPSLLER